MEKLKVTSTVETITPEMAVKYLESSKGNTRNTNDHVMQKAVIAKYARQMKAGKWEVNGEAIIFDENDCLMAGHHRMAACIEAGVSFDTVVTRGILRKTIDTTNLGRKITLSQMLCEKGVKDYAIAASIVAAANTLATYGRLHANNSQAGTKRLVLAANEVQDMYYADEVNYIEATEFAVQYRRSRVMPLSWVGGLYYHLKNVGNYAPDFIQAFFDGVCTFGDSNIQAANALRKRIMEDRFKSGVAKLTPFMMFALFTKAWNAYVTGKDVVRIVYQPNVEKAYPTLKLND